MLWRTAMGLARGCEDDGQLMERVMRANAEFRDPLPTEEVARLVASAWKKETAGENWVGGSARAALTREEILDCRLSGNAMRLWLLLKASHDRRNGPFAIAQSEVAELLGVHQPKMPGLIRQLIELGKVRCVHQGGRSKGDPSLYVLVAGLGSADA